MKLQVYRGEDIISEFDIDEGTVYTGKLNEARKITCPVNQRMYWGYKNLIKYI